MRGWLAAAKSSKKLRLSDLLFGYITLGQGEKEWVT
jgi:hypothetical protein